MSVVIATSTFYPVSGVRSQEALSLAKEANRVGIRLVIVDGGSYDGFAEALAETGNLVKVYKQHKEGMAVGRREALARAYDLSKDGVVVWTEPEKVSFVESVPSVVKPILANKYSMVLPSRDSLSSYPTAQKLSEDMATVFVDILLRQAQEWDEYFGPFACDGRSLRYFLEYQPLQDVPYRPDTWDATHVPRVDVLAAGLPIGVVKVAYRHPVIQTLQESRSLDFTWKRVIQHMNILPGLWNRAYRLNLTAQKPPDHFF